MSLEKETKQALAKEQLGEWYKQQYIAENNAKIANKIDDEGMKNGAIALLKRCEAAIDFLNEEIASLEKDN